MNCEEINIYIHDFADGLLNEAMKPEIESHISKCEKCRNHYLALVRLFDVIETHHESIVPPQDLIEKMYGELLAKSQSAEPAEKEDSHKKKKLIEKEKLDQDRTLRMMSAAARKSAVTRTSMTKIIPQRAPSFELPLRKILLILLPLVLLAVTYFIGDFMKYNSPWRIVAVKGRYFLNGKPDNLNRLSSGKTVLTDDKSQVIVNVPLVGRIDVGANTTFTVEKAKDGDNRINLRRGALKVTSLADVPYLSIQLKNIFVYDRGGVFSVVTDDFDNSNVSVEIGNVVIEKNDKMIFLSDGYTCSIDNKGNIGIPFRQDASEDFKTAVKQIEDNSGDKKQSVEILLRDLRQSDLLTLLSVIPRVDESEREALYGAIAAQFAPPDGTTEKGILNADDEMLQSWWDEIEWQL